MLVDSQRHQRGSTYAHHVHSHDGVEFDTPEASPVVRSPSDLIHFSTGVVIWAVGMRSGRIAHRDLRLANVMLDSGELPWIFDFGFSELAPVDAVIDTDIAELIASTSIKVDPERAIGAAVSVLGSEPVCAAASRMQPPLLRGATRAALKADPELRRAITVALESACGGERIEYDSVQRFRPFLEQK